MFTAMGSDAILQQDLKDICEADIIPWDSFSGRSFLISGATGLIGKNVIKALLYANERRKLGIKILAMVRNKEKAFSVFKDCIQDPALEFVFGNIEEMPQISQEIDHIIHGASQTSSRAFVDKPVETIETALKGTENLLKLGESKKIKGMVYLSSMEVYGYPQKGHKVTETDCGAISPLDIRNSYPLSKLMCEGICRAYAAEYGVPVSMIRLTQTFGPGVMADDKRIFGYFSQCVRNKEDIVLKTKGETQRSYLYTADAVTAILLLLLKGKTGEAYNAADESTYCSIAEMADMIAGRWGLKVCYMPDNKEKNAYLNTLYMDLDTAKLKDLGWKLLGGGKTVTQMFERMIGAMETL